MATKILVVEDSASVRRLIREALERDGYEITESSDGEEALAAFRAAAPSLVITDIHMPTMDGLSLVRSIRALPDFRFVPILILTTEDGDEMKQLGRAAGASGWMVKPFHGDQLRQTVARVLRPGGPPA